MDVATAFGMLFGLACVVWSIMSSPDRLFGKQTGTRVRFTQNQVPDAR